jgi:Cu(I)/Ag(I) efflux system membrane fusion protein
MELKNPSKKYIPGMLAVINVKTNEKEGLILPLNAVLQSEKGNTVWIQNNEGSFEVRMVTIGIQNSDSVEIISGLNANENVVISGAYLLNSEYILKNGSDPMSGMEM